MSIQEIQAWLNTHPKIKGGLIVAEGAAVGTLINVFQTGSPVLTKQGIENLAVAVVGAVYLSLKNYFTTPAVALPTTAQP